MVDITGAQLKSFSAYLAEREASTTGVSMVPGLNGAGTGVVAARLPFDDVKNRGASGDGATDDRARIQAALDAGRPVYLPEGTYIVGASGNTISSRAYGLLIPDGAVLVGAGSGKTVIKAAANSDMDVLTTPRATPITNVTIKGITVDGNEANQGVAGGFNYWLHNVTGLVLDDARSKNPGSFGIRIEMCDRVFLDQAFTDHSAETNSDGIHFVDTINVTVGTAQVYTEGDDAFIIEADNRDVYNYAIGQIIVTAPTSVISAAKRGLAIFADPTQVAASPLISNINVASLVAENCDGQAITLSGASFEDITIRAVVKDCESFLSAYPGNGVVYTGYMKRCSFTGVGANFTGRAIDTGEGSGSPNTIEGCHIDVLIANPGDGFEGVVLTGDEWSGAIRLDYDPDNDKASPTYGIVIHGSDNDLSISAKGAATNLQLRSTATNNNIKLGYLKGADTNDLQIDASATGNRFSGGRIDGVVLNNGGSTNIFENVGGCTYRGRVSMNFATSADGKYTWAHGLKGTPNWIGWGLNTVANLFHLRVESADATNVVFNMTNTAGAAITSGTYNVYVKAQL